MKEIFTLKFAMTEILLILLFIYGTGPVSCQEEDLNVFTRWVEWTDGSHMLVHHLNKQAFSFLDKRDEVIKSLNTKEDWAGRQKNVRDVLMKIVGPFPEKTPLNAKITGTIKKEGYRIEKVIYESMPAFYVTGCLYIPDGKKGKKPAILFVSGHAQEAFRYNEYQIMILNLVKKGFIVFAIDPVSQGERVQLFDPVKNASAIGPTTREHGYLGNQCFLTGVSLARYFIWDGIRGIDYLLTRKEVDPERLGVTGQSGGGTQSAYIFAFDERIKAGAPVNYITGFRRLLESIGPQDAEQNFYHGILNGITHADLLEIRAPNPALIVAGTRDFFSIQGARETYSEVKRAYSAFGQGNNIGIIEDDWGHGYTRKLREGICAFFQNSLDLPGNPGDEMVTIPDQSELNVTPTGQVATSAENPQNVFMINKREAQTLLNRIKVSRENINPHIELVRSKAKELSGYLAPQGETSYVFRGRYQRNGYSVEMYALHGEGDCIVPLLLFLPGTTTDSPAVIYCHPKGKAADAAAGGRIEQLVKKGYAVAAPDLTGTGETAGPGNVAMLIGRSVAGIQAGDIVRTVNFLKGRKGIDRNRIGAIAFDEMCPVLLHAAAFEKSINTVLLSGSLISYRSVVMNPFYNQGFCGNYVPGAITAYDLPDLIGCIAPRKICLAGLNDQEKKPVRSGVTDEELLFPLNVYSGMNLQGNIKITGFPENTNDIETLLDWSYR
jgi:dienelactone hydrolase